MTPMDPPDVDEFVNHDHWESPLDRDWLGAEAAVRVRDRRNRWGFNTQFSGLMLISVGFAVGFLAGGLAWCGARQLFGKKRGA